nr:unnamed protein product [Callosobruchus analis]
MRCFKCQKFGHTSMKCNSEQVCVCGKPLHEGSACEEPITCVNCQGNHSARSRNCPVFKQEFAIQECRVRNNITYSEAKKLTVIPTPSKGISYSQATSSKPDTDRLIKELIPQIVDALKNTFALKTSTTHPFITPSIPTTTKTPFRPRNLSIESRVSATSTAESEKRLRESSSESEQSTSQTASEQQSTKKKKGWPKGKPRSSTCDNP